VVKERNGIQREDIYGQISSERGENFFFEIPYMVKPITFPYRGSPFVSFKADTRKIRVKFSFLLIPIVWIKFIGRLSQTSPYLYGQL
jgi:hypothetical protein